MSVTLEGFVGKKRFEKIKEALRSVDEYWVIERMDSLWRDTERLNKAVYCLKKKLEEKP